MLKAFENRVMRRLFGPKEDKVTGGWRNLHVEEVSDLYFTPNISCDQIEKNEVGVSCSTYGGEKRCIQTFWWGNLREKAHLEDQVVYGSTILRQIFKTWVLWAGSGLI